MDSRRFLPWLGGVAAAGVALGLFSAGCGLLRADRLAGLLPNPFRSSSWVAPSGPVVLQSVQRLERLETSRYRGQVVVKGDTGGLLPHWLSGDRLVFLGHGEVVAGLDLSRLGPDDLRVVERRVEVRLPRPEILHTRLDNQQSEVFSRETGLLSGPDRTLESRTRVEAETRLEQAALESGILSDAEANARESLRRHLETLGFREVRFL